MFTEITIELLQLFIVMFGSPLLVGVIRKAKARLQGRRGASVFQPYADIRKLFLKEVVISENTSWIFRFTPYLLVTTMLLSALIVPVRSHNTLPYRRASATRSPGTCPWSQRRWRSR